MSAETLVERLRNPAWSHGGGLPSVLDTDTTLADLLEAAAEIEALRAARDEALAALKDIAFLRPLGPTRNKLVEQMERIAINALEKCGNG